MASGSFSVIKNNLNGVIYRGNLNNLFEGGVYSVTGSNVTNGPAGLVSDSTGNLMVIYTPIVTHQFLFVGNTIVYMRRYVYGSWSVWAKTTLTPET